VPKAPMGMPRSHHISHAISFHHFALLVCLQQQGSIALRWSYATRGLILKTLTQIAALVSRIAQAENISFNSG
jgi:hypothetical protein